MNENIYQLLFEEEAAKDLDPAPPKPESEPDKQKPRQDKPSPAPDEKDKDKPQAQPRQQVTIEDMDYAGIGGGRFSKEVRLAGKLSEEDPEQLMANLGVRAVGKGSFPKQLLSVIRQSILGTSTMSEAYLGATLKSSKEGSQYIVITPRKLSGRNSLKYMVHVVMGAYNSGVVPEYVGRGALKFNLTGDQTIIQFRNA